MRQYALADFGTSLNRIRTLANSIVSDTASALADAAVRELHETQQCGAVVLLTGYFEAFLKDLVRRYIEDLSTSGVAFLKLPENIRDKHFQGGGEELSKVVVQSSRRRPVGNATAEDLVTRLHSAFDSTDSYQIVWEGFADTQANPGPSVVNDIAKGLGLQDFWRQVSKHSGDPTRWSDSALKTKLGDLIAKRNACAHTGTVSPIPTASDILDFADMLQAIGTGFVASLEVELANHRASAATATVAAAGKGDAVPASR
jgi:hypothetical protein